ADVLYRYIVIRRRARSTPLPYTPLFRSVQASDRRRNERLIERATVPSRRTARSGIAEGTPSRWGSQLPARSVARRAPSSVRARRSEEHTSELQSRENLVCRRLREKKYLL